MPRYETPRVKLYEGSADDVLATLMDEPIGVVLTDPPYWCWAHLEESKEQQVLDLRLETLWMGDVLMMTLAWFPMVRAMRPGLAWVFADPHYAAIYMRVARYLKWPMVGWWPASRGKHEEYLLAFSDDVFHVGIWSERALLMNTYGQAKSVEMLKQLLTESPSGLVLDPFCGSGSSLVAALQDGRSAIGIELDAATMAKTEALLRSVEV